MCSRRHLNTQRYVLIEPVVFLSAELMALFSFVNNFLTLMLQNTS